MAYYACTFRRGGQCSDSFERYYTLLLDYHPAEYLAKNGNVSLINHIKLTKKQFDKFRGGV